MAHVHAKASILAVLAQVLSVVALDRKISAWAGFSGRGSEARPATSGVSARAEPAVSWATPTLRRSLLSVSWGLHLLALSTET
jgi:hypothetical protein